MITSITKDSVVLVTGSAGMVVLFSPSREASEVALLTAIPNRPVLLRARFREREKERERERTEEKMRIEFTTSWSPLLRYTSTGTVSGPKYIGRV